MSPPTGFQRLHPVGKRSLICSTASRHRTVTCSMSSYAHHHTPLETGSRKLGFRSRYRPGEPTPSQFEIRIADERHGFHRTRLELPEAAGRSLFVVCYAAHLSGRSRRETSRLARLTNSSPCSVPEDKVPCTEYAEG